jgi:hypothetical protein
VRRLLTRRLIARREKTSANRRRKKMPLSVGQGLRLIFGIAMFVGLMATIAYFVFFLPILRSNH